MKGVIVPILNLVCPILPVCSPRLCVDRGRRSPGLCHDVYRHRDLCSVGPSPCRCPFYYHLFSSCHLGLCLLDHHGRVLVAYRDHFLS
ncbi:hypothetical protein EV702DRAFT_1153758 [Suillus placidus]|uniref:Secreted protein n=1 Tax=Suillus placidus TaxID=48579 RepID=A0A9P7CVQ1_9AGAM|nr:hypothetical protein EV702DRAFT_1153758 [Suillus placidus]